MYFVDREKIEQLLRQMEDILEFYKSQSSWEGRIESLALERLVHIVIESILDVGNAMIDGFIMRDPGSYEDIIDILLDEKVLSADDEEPYKAVIAFRKPLVQNYLEINHAQIIEGINGSLTYLEQFPTKVRSYIENELGPVSAFKR
ncbi:DUF86 domain-containing protein [Bacillus sp. Marseille-P3661]|uniref:DUF86 domain-containing protein n=1 Tax=Bacillus sp. Marseille-P3661 TaxID=1936234 RepID=UPI000C8318A4|nr:DUF86 domain-containing protein [Bacillus sp. Marseille-P3661]